MGVLSVILLGLAGTYCCTLVWLRSGFRSACRNRSGSSGTSYISSSGKTSRSERMSGSDRHLTVSVIVPARNEVANIVTCLESIFANDYEDFEVLVVDDASEDQTSEVVQSFSTKRGLSDRLRVIKLAEPSRENATGHKKRAINAGIEASRGDIIVTTDADSVVPKQWLQLLVDTFSEDVDFVSAPVAYREGRSILEQAIALEMLGLVAAGGGAISNGHPNMCNGANLAYRRRAFDRVGGFRSIDDLASGDDVLLMLKISAARPGSVRFCADRDALVITKPAGGWREFVRQRQRWASKGLDLNNSGATAVALLVYTFHAALLLSILTALFNPGLWPAVAAAFALKVVSEGLLLHASCHHFDRLYLLRSLVVAQLLHVPYVVSIGFLGIFGSGFTWKGRELAR